MENEDQNDPNAQGQQAAAETQVPQPPQTGEGIQSRIDQLVARIHEGERRQNELLAKNTELMQKLTERNLPAQPAEEAPEIDPEDAKKIDYFVNKRTSALSQQVEQLTGTLKQAQTGAAMAQVEEKLSKLKNPAVAARTRELVAAWQKDPRFAHATPNDAYYLALGEAAEGKLGAASTSQTQRTAFNDGGAPVATGHGGSPKPIPPGQQPIEKQLEAADLNEMSFDDLTNLTRGLDAKFPHGIPLSDD